MLRCQDCDADSLGCVKVREVQVCTEVYQQALHNSGMAHALAHVLLCKA